VPSQFVSTLMKPPTVHDTVGENEEDENAVRNALSSTVTPGQFVAGTRPATVGDPGLQPMGSVTVPVHVCRSDRSAVLWTAHDVPTGTPMYVMGLGGKLKHVN